MMRTVVFAPARGIIGNQFLGASQIEFKPFYFWSNNLRSWHVYWFFYLSPPSMQSLQTRCAFLLCLPFLAGLLLTHVLIKFALHKPLCRRILNLIIASAEIIIVTEEQCALRRRAHAHILLATMLKARKFLLVPMISPAVNVVRPVVILDNFVPLRPTLART